MLWKVLKALIIAGFVAVTSPATERADAAAPSLIPGVPACYICEFNSDLDYMPGEIYMVPIYWYSCEIVYEGDGFLDCDATQPQWHLEIDGWHYGNECEVTGLDDACRGPGGGSLLASYDIGASGRRVLAGEPIEVSQVESRGCGNVLLAREYRAETAERLRVSTSVLAF